MFIFVAINGSARRVDHVFIKELINHLQILYPRRILPHKQRQRRDRNVVHALKRSEIFNMYGIQQGCFP